MNSPPAMNQHDPNEDPFAALSSDFDSKMLTLPTEYGSGAVDPTKNSQITPPSSPKKEGAEQEEGALSPSPKEPKEDENAPKEDE